MRFDLEETPTGVDAALAAGMTAYGFAGAPHANAAALQAAGATIFRQFSQLFVILTRASAGELA